MASADDAVAIVFHSDGLLFRQGEVGSGTPVEVVVVVMLAVEVEEAMLVVALSPVYTACITPLPVLLPLT